LWRAMVHCHDHSYFSSFQELNRLMSKYLKLIISLNYNSKGSLIGHLC
jgi:hypothetical protein